MPNTLPQAVVILYNTLDLMCCTENLLNKLKEMFCISYFWFVDTSLLRSKVFSTHYIVKKKKSILIQNEMEFIAFSLA